MAKKYGQALAEVKVYINGKEQAARDLDDLKKKAEGFKNAIKETERLRDEATARQNEARKRANAATKGSAEHTAAVQEMLEEQKIIDEQNRKLIVQREGRKQLNKIIRETEKFSKNIAEDLDNLSGQSIQRLKEMQRQLEAMRTKLKPEQDPEGEFLNLLNEAITDIVETIKNKKGDLIEFKDIVDDLTNIDDTSLAKAEQRLRALIAATDKDDVDRLKQLNEELDRTVGEKNRRIGVQGEAVLGGDYTKTIESTKEAIELLKKYQSTLETTDTDKFNEIGDAIKKMNADMEQAIKKQSRETLTTNLQTSGTDDIKQAVDWLTKYQGTLEPLSDEWRNIGDLIKAGDERLKQLTDTVKREAMEKQFGELKDLSANALAEQLKYWEGIRDNAKATDAEYKTAIDNIKQIKDLTDSRTLKSSTDTLTTGLQTSGTDDIKQSVDWLIKYQGTLEPLSDEWRNIGDLIKAGDERLKQLTDTVKREAMEKQFGELKDLSANALAEQLKYWEGIRDNAKATDAEYKTAIDNIKQIKDLTDSRTLKSSTDTLTTGLQTSGTDDIKQSVDWLTKYQGTLEPLSDEWRNINDLIKAGDERLKQLANTVKQEAMGKQFADLKDLSVNALAEQKKYWKEVKNNFAEGTSQYYEAANKLKEIRELENTRTEVAARVDIHAALSGKWNRTIEDTEKAIKLIEEYKKQLHVKTDAPAIDEANQAITILNQNLGKAKGALMDVSQAFDIGDQIKTGNFDGTTEEILRAKKALEEYRKTLKQKTDVAEIKKVDEALRNITNSAEQAKNKLVNIDDVLGRLDKASVDELQAAAKQLQDKLQGATRGVEDYAKTAAKLRDVNLELKKAKKEWEGQENVILRTAKRLAAYVAVYGSYNFIAGKVQELVSLNLQLSDSIADVEKTTGLSAEKLSQLGEEIRAIDTRTTQEQLYQLAAAAGQLGLKSETDIAGFVRAANMITVSLNELGTEATTQLMKIATLTGEIENGTEQAMLSIGSAINELTANSAAAAGPIVDLMNRMGGVAAQAKLNSAEMAAIGATADALGQSMEITGTSMNKFLTTLMSNTDQIAYALNMDAKALRSFINEGRTMDAVIAIFERMNNMGGLGALAGVMGDLGSEGARMTQVLAALAGRVDLLKGQLDISNEAYREAVSIQNEYNVKNENAIAILQRMGNAIKEFFVNNVVVDGITAVLRAVYNFFSLLKEGTAGAKFLTSAIVAMTAALLANRIAWVQNIQAMTAAHPLLMRRVIWSALTTAVHTLTAALKTGALAIKSFGLSLLQANTWTNLWSKSLKGLKTLLAGNWITLAVGAVAALGTWIYKTATYVSEAAKATAKYNRELQEEKDKVDQLFNSLKRLNTSESDRARIINSINQQYGQYLGFMLDEKDSAEKLAAAHQLINAELRKRMALNLQNTLTGNAQNDYSTKLEKTIADIETKVGNTRVRITKKDGTAEDRKLYASDVMNTVSEMINDRVYESVKVTQEEVNGQIVHRQQMGTVDLDKLKADIRAALEKEFENVQTYDAKGNIIKGDETFTGRLVFGNVESYIKSMLEERIKYQKSIINAENQANIELRSATKAVLKQRENINEELTTEIKNAQDGSEKLEANLQAADKALKAAEAAAKKYAKDDKSEAAETARENLTEAQQNYAAEEKALKDHYEKIADNAYDYIDNQREILKEHYSNIDSIKDENLRKQKEKERDAINAQIEEYTNIAKEAAKKVPGFDPWDKERDVKDWREFSEIVTNLDSSSAKALAAAFKKIKDEAALFPDDVKKVSELFQSQGVDEISIEKLGLTDAKSVADLVFNWETQIKDKLKNKFHRNTTLGFIFESEGSGSSDRDMKAEARRNYQAAMSALEAYYKEYEDFVRQKREQQLITEEDMNRQLLDNTRKYNEDKQQLIKKFLGEESTFDQTQYVGILTKYDYFKDKDLDEMAKQYQQWGDAMTDGGRNQMAKAGVEIRKAINKEQEKIKAELLKGDMFATFENNFAEMLDELGVLTSGLEDWADQTLNAYNKANGKEELFGLTPKERQQRISELVKFADQSYQVNADGLRRLMMQDTAFANWVKYLTDDQINVMLLKLRGYYDDRLALTKRHQEQMKKEFEAYYEQTGQQNSYDRQKQSIDQSKAYQSDLEGYGVRPDYDKNRENIAKQADLDLRKKDAEIESYENQWSAANDKLFKAASEGNDDQLRVAQAEMQAAWDAMAQAEVERNELLAQSQRDLTQVYMDEWTKRAEKWGSVGEMFGEYLGEQLALEKQANDARARGDEETAKKLEQQQKQNQNNMIKNLLNFIVDEAALWAKEQALKMMFNALELSDEKKKAIEEVALKGRKSLTNIATSAAEGQAEESKKGLSGLITGAIVFAATMALQAFVKSSIANMFPEASIGSTASRKLSTGMLTYAEGNYPVLGNDGKVYDAKYEGSNLKTGIYGGGAHFGIFSEKQPEMIVDGKTTQKLILNYPYIYDAITTIAKNGRLVNAMPTFASGDYPAGMQRIAQVEAVDMAGGTTPDMERMSAALEQSNAVIAKLNQILVSGQISANVDPYANSKATKRAERFMKRRGID